MSPHIRNLQTVHLSLEMSHDAQQAARNNTCVQVPPVYSSGSRPSEIAEDRHFNKLDHRICGWSVQLHLHEPVVGRVDTDNGESPP